MCINPITQKNKWWFIVFPQWFPEVKHFCGDTPVILIGCKTDLRKDKECTRRLKATNQAPITYTQVRPHQRQPRATAPAAHPRGVINGLPFAGWGDSAADERRALPGVFGKVSGERGRNIQGGYQKNFGFYPQTEEPQKEEDMRHLVTTAGKTGGARTGWWRIKYLLHHISKYQRSTFKLHFKGFTSYFF